jgi:hypothetical protein
VEALRGAAEVQLFRDRHEISQVPKLHLAAPLCSECVGPTLPLSVLSVNTCAPETAIRITGARMSGIPRRSRVCPTPQPPS